MRLEKQGLLDPIHDQRSNRQMYGSPSSVSRTIFLRTKRLLSIDPSTRHHVTPRRRGPCSPDRSSSAPTLLITSALTTWPTFFRAFSDKLLVAVRIRCVFRSIRSRFRSTLRRLLPKRFRRFPFRRPGSVGGSGSNPILSGPSWKYFEQAFRVSSASRHRPPAFHRA